MINVQIWQAIIAVLGTAVGAEVVKWLLGRGKLRSDDAFALRKELRDENKELKIYVDALELRVKELESDARKNRLMRIDMYRVLQESNIDREVLAQLRIIEAGA